MRTHYICRCYFDRNIFIKSFNTHFTYRDKESFRSDNHEFLKSFTENEIEDLATEITKEIKRRHHNGKTSLQRKLTILKSYMPLHEEVYKLQPHDLSPSFLEMVEFSRQPGVTKENLISKFLNSKGLDIYTCPVFTKEFCRLFVEELQHFEASDLPKGRPNTMNTTGILLEELGFYPDCLDVLRRNYLLPIASLLYPDWMDETGLDSQRAFVVTYTNDATDLSSHFDNSEVTLNVCLGESFEGGELFFQGMRKQHPTSRFVQVAHAPGVGVFHRGQQYHGALPLTRGKRYNLIMWMRSSGVRSQLCPMCDEPPVLVETEGDGDGFTPQHPLVNVCRVL